MQGTYAPQKVLEAKNRPWAKEKSQGIQIPSEEVRSGMFLGGLVPSQKVFGCLGDRDVANLCPGQWVYCRSQRSQRLLEA